MVRHLLGMSLFVPGYHAMRNRSTFANQYWADVTVYDIAHGRNRNARETRKHAGTEGGRGSSGRTHMCDSEQWRSTKAVGGKCEGGVGTERAAAACCVDQRSRQMSNRSGSHVRGEGREERYDRDSSSIIFVSTSEEERNHVDLTLCTRL